MLDNPLRRLEANNDRCQFLLKRKSFNGLNLKKEMKMSYNRTYYLRKMIINQELTLFPVFKVVTVLTG